MNNKDFIGVFLPFVQNAIIIYKKIGLKIKTIIILINLLIFSNCSHHQSSFSTELIVEKKIELKEAKTTREKSHIYFVLAQIYLKKKMLNLAISNFELAEKNAKESFGKENIFVAKTLDGRAEVYYVLERYNKSLSYYKKAYEIKKILSPLPSEEKIITLFAMGENHAKLNQNEKAIKALEEALDMSLYLHGEHNSYSVKINNLLSIVKKGDGKFKLSLKSYRLLYGNNSLEVADIYVDMALQRKHSSKENEALDFYDKAVNIYSEKLPLLDKKIFTTYYKMALLDKQLEQTDLYFLHSLKAFDGLYQNQELIFSTLNSDEKKRYLNEHKKIIHNLFDAYTGKNPKELFNRWLNYKRKLFDEENNLALLSTKVKDKLKLNSLMDKKRALAQAYQKKEIDKKYIENLSTEISKLEEFFSLNYFYHKGEQSQPISYRDVARLLKPKELYIDFAKVEKYYYIFTVDTNEKVIIKKLTKENSRILEETIVTFREDVSSLLPEKYMKRLCGKFYKIVFDKIDIKGKTSLVISPDNLLNSIPFEVFYDDKDEKYLIEKLTITYIPSGREFINLHNHHQKSKGEIVVFSDVDFEENPNLNSSKSRGTLFDTLEGGWKKLKYSKEESRVIKELYPTAQLFLGKEASERNLFEVESPKILHLATHGVYLSNKEISNPLLRSFLLLSGTNSAIKNCRGEGLVSALEISGLNLRGTELVVLSACETGLGEVEDFEGVSGIAKAFIKAGTQNAMVSLWSIDDKATAYFMKEFYRNIKNGQNYAEALRSVKLLMLKNSNFKEPFYWSALINIGIGFID